MRIYMHSSGIPIIISNYENEFLEMCTEGLRKSDLDERQQEAARKLVSKGVLNRHKDDQGIYFKKA